MKKIPGLFKRDYKTGLIYNEVVNGSEWVQQGEGIATRKHDGTACSIIDGKLYRRYDAKINKETGKYKRPVPDGAIPCQEPDFVTGHHPHWVQVDIFASSDKYYTEGLCSLGHRENGTYELCGEKIQSNPEKITGHKLIRHGSEILKGVPTDFEELRGYLDKHYIEGIVWQHPDGRMVKIKRKDLK